MKPEEMEMSRPPRAVRGRSLLALTGAQRIVQPTIGVGRGAGAVWPQTCAAIRLSGWLDPEVSVNKVESSAVRRPPAKPRCANIARCLAGHPATLHAIPAGVDHKPGLQSREGGSELARQHLNIVELVVS
eukprot:3162457-Prymnesium_polylepis.3